MFFGYVRDTQDWVPVGFLLLTIVCLTCFVFWLWADKSKKETKKKGWLDNSAASTWKCMAALSGLMLVLTLIFGSMNVVRHHFNDLYDQGIAYEEAGNFSMAYDTFVELRSLTGDYKDVDDHIELNYSMVQYMYGMDRYNAGDWWVAFYHFNKAGTYMNSDELAAYCYQMYLSEHQANWK